MNWKILNVSIPVKNLEVSKDFYNKLLNNELEDKLFYKNFFVGYNVEIFIGLSNVMSCGVGMGSKL